VIDRLTSKRFVLVLVLGAACVILVSGSREWVQGSVDDAVLGASAVRGRGADVAPGAMAAALVGLAAAVAAATSGRVVRVVASCSALLAAVLGAAVVVSVLADPGGALGAMAVAGTGRSGTAVADGRAGIWVWAALLAMAAMAAGGVAALAGGRRWEGLSGRYDAGEPGPRQGSAWDQLSRGEDPTTGR
jgi:uncharacterized membrane protein (TIGR02234 family)